jgi:hypothetical protein
MLAQDAMPPRDHQGALWPMPLKGGNRSKKLNSTWETWLGRPCLYLSGEVRRHSFGACLCFRRSFWAAGAVIGHDGLSAVCWPLQLAHLMARPLEWCSAVRWFGSPQSLHLGASLHPSVLCSPQHFLHWCGLTPLETGYSTFRRAPMSTTVLGESFNPSARKASLTEGAH